MNISIIEQKPLYTLSVLNIVLTRQQDIKADTSTF